MTPEEADEQRDEFSETTKAILAKRAGYLCSVPSCRKLTIGPSDDRASRVTSIGVAAHITAASKRGPRYDRKITPEERKSEANGIWVCQNHGKSIDDNESVQRKDDLVRWKKQHEEWIFKRVAGAEEEIESGIARVKLFNIGRFKTAAEVEFGKNSVVLTDGSKGKSTVCQALAAFSGGEHFAYFQKRFSFNCEDEQHRMIGAELLVGGAKTCVALSQVPTILPNRSKVVKSRLSYEVDGGLYVDWPRDSFNVIKLDNTLWFRERRALELRNAVQYLAAMLQIPEDNIWGILIEEHFITSIFGTSFRRTGRRKADIRGPGGIHYHDEHGVGPTVLTYAFLDLALKLVTASRNTKPWTLVIDTTFFTRLDQNNRSKIFTTLFKLREPALQVVLCVEDEESLKFLKDLAPDSWTGASSAQGVTVHRFQ